VQALWKGKEMKGIIHPKPALDSEFFMMLQKYQEEHTETEEEQKELEKELFAELIAEKVVEKLKELNK
jgi:hypothetical protein